MHSRRTRKKKKKKKKFLSDRDLQAAKKHI